MSSERAFISFVASGDSETVDRALRVVDAAPGRHPGSGITPLVARARAGDRAALEDVTRQELPRVARMLHRLLGWRPDMDDLVQTVFLEMCRALPGFRGDSSFSTFVGGIAVRVALRAMRPAAWTRLRAEAPDEPPASDDHPERNVMAAEQLRRVARALDDISQKKRVAFTLWALEGMDVRSVAAATGATVAATRSRIYYAQKELKAAAASDPYLRELVEGPDAR